MKNVLLIDSGSGGVNILKECLRVCPCANFLMFCDNKNLPYGDKDKKFLIDTTMQNLREIEKIFKFDIVIFACNTLTSVCIDACRGAFPKVKFVGTVPAIKPALEEFKEEEIAVLATKVTLENSLLLAKHPSVMRVQMRELATLIDQNLDNLAVLEGILCERLAKLDVKAIVLGCTHYVAVKDLIEKCLPKAKVFDGANGVARRLESLLGGKEEGYSVKIVTSKDDDMWAKLWNFLNEEE